MNFPSSPTTGPLRRAPSALLALLLATLLPACSSTGSTTGEPGTVQSDADLHPPLSRVVRIFDGATGDEVDFGTLIDSLATVDAVFLGETHLDEVTHRFEHAVLEGLLAAKSGDVVLAMEMFTRADQPALDEYLAGTIDERTFGERARLWSNYRTGYRALVETAKRAGIPVVGSNLAPAARRKVAMQGAEGFAALTDEERGGVSAELLPNDPLYWERFDRTLRGHGGSFMPSGPEERLHSVQSLWDNTMGESCALALAAHPGATVLHVNGGFHTRGGLGTADQFAQRAPDATLATVAIVPVDDLAAIDLDGADDRGTFVVFAEARALGYSEGTRAVTLSRELEYRLHVPDDTGGSAADAGFPLLVWFPDEGASAEEEATRWRLLLGESAAIAVPEFPYPHLAEDFHRTGRYTWDDTFSEDLGSFAGAADRVIEQVIRYFPVDAERVVIAGAGAGGQVAAAVRWMDRDGPVALAIDPGSVGRLAEAGLPDPKDPRGGVLTVLADPAHVDEWTAEVADRASVGFPGKVEALTGAGQPLAVLRDRLGLPAVSKGGAARTLALSHGSPLARQWAELVAAHLVARDGGSFSVEVLPADGDLPDDPADGSLWLEADLVPIHDPTIDRPHRAMVPAITPALFESGRGIPMPQGAFGGTVVLVLPEHTEETRRAAWKKLEEDDVTRKRSRFVGVRVAESGRGRDLPAVLDELRDEGKSVVRIVPITFCATADEMRALRASIEGHTEGLRIAWSPGLGGTVGAVLAGPPAGHP